MKKKNKFEGHPFENDYDVLNEAFNALKRSQDEYAMTLRGYKGVTKEAYEQLQYENERIKEVKTKILKALHGAITQ